MARLILFNMVTLDGMIEGPGRDIAWHRVDDDFNRFAVEQLDSVAGLVFGRVTYELMAAYWPTPAAVRSDPMIARRMNALPKYVFSTTLSQVSWENTHLFSGNADSEMAQIKQRSGGDLLLMGSADLAATFTQRGLIDEYRLMVNPVALGRGTPLFKDTGERLDLVLLRVRTFANGNVLLAYRPEPPPANL